MGLSLPVRRLTVIILFLGVFFSAGIFLSEKAEAQSMKPTITRHDVNGFETILVNTHTGNSVIFAANVQAGMDHDDPIRTSGLTHLWEHVIHNGSKRFPGYETLDRKFEGLGVSRNANTSGTRTYYFFSGHVDSFEKALPLYGAMFSEPEWNADSFEKEKKIVMNEALEYQHRDDMILYSAIKLRTLPPGHQFAKYHIGTQEQLAATTADDLKALYRNNYRPGSTQLIVVGNFDTVADAEVTWNQDRVLGLLRENFIPTQEAPTAAPAKDMRLPDLTLTEPQKAWVEMATPNAKHTLMSQFQIDETLPWEVVETIMDFLNSDFEGSLKKELLDRSWILNGGFYFDQTNNYREGTFQFALTPEGAANRQELVKLIFSYIGKLKQKGFTTEERDFLYQGNVASYWESTSQTVSVARAISDRINHGQKVDDYFEFERRYGSVTSDQVKASIAKIFNPSRLVVAYMGPDVKSDEVDPLFKRAIKYPANTTTLLAELKSELENPRTFSKDATLQIAKIDLPRREQVLSGKSEVTTPILTDNDRWVLEADHTYPNAAYHVILDLPHLSLMQDTQLQVLVAAFYDRYKAEIAYLSGIQVWGGISGVNSRLDIEMKGNARSSFAALQFILDKLIHFVPNQAEIERAAQKLKNTYLATEDGFSASLAFKEAAGLMNSLSYSQKEVAETASSPEFKITDQDVETLFHAARITGGTAGDASTEEALEMLAWIRKRIQPLSPSQLAARENALVTIKNPTRFFRPMIASKSAAAIGRARVYSLGTGEARDAVIASLVGEYLWQQVFDVNRVKNNLGYVQGGSAMPTQNDSRLFLYGQTEGTDRAPLIETGWQEVLAKIPNDANTIDRFRQGRILSSRVIPESLRDRLERRLGSFRLRKDPMGPEQNLQILRSVDGQKVAEWFSTHFKPQTFVDVEVAVTACRDALSNINEARKAIAGQ